MNRPTYLSPQIVTLSASQVLAALGPASAGSQKGREERSAIFPVAKLD